MRRLLVVLVSALLLLGCAGQGAERENGRQMPGSDRDEHGCIGSAGYRWCPELSKCVREWEEDCPSLRQRALEEQAKGYCGDGNRVYLCGQYIKVVSSAPDAGSRFYTLGKSEPAFVCPTLPPENMSEKCRLLLFGSNCMEKKIC
ncbi:MAG: hypothetical protein N3E51_04660 [Candidatus Micrarchaeota archaeon]|nr:hypothetical protein [Candidatus Micrarchaeota archaeon]